MCVHAFIEKLKDGTIATYQTLPWNHRGWHAGGDANNTHISFEICEDGLTDKTYFNKVSKEAVELATYLCNRYKLTEKNIIGHYEGYQKRIASNHGDPRHWFSKHDKSIDTFMADVKKELAKGASTSKPATDGKKLYRVQIGAYSVKRNADKQLEKAKKAGFKDAFVKYEYMKITEECNYSSVVSLIIFCFSTIAPDY